MNKYQELNPNNSRIYVDYRKEKDKVRFEYVGKDNVLKIAMQMTLSLFLRGLIVLPMITFTIFTLTTNYGSQQTFNIFLYTLGMIQFTNMIIFWFLLVSATLAYTNALKYMPKLSTIGNRSNRVIFNNKNSKTRNIEIPLFKNVKLTYKATKDFSYYLQRVEIVEHPFNMINKKGENKGRNPYLWKANFIYSKVPKEGELRVNFI